MSKVITFSRYFPKSFPLSSNAGKETYFVEQIINSTVSDWKKLTKEDINKDVVDLINPFIINDRRMIKKHIIRAGKRWKQGEIFSPRIWSGKPYASKQIQFLPEMKLQRVYDIEIFVKEWFSKPTAFIKIGNNEEIDLSINLGRAYLENIAKNDGLTYNQFIGWFGLLPMNILNGKFKGFSGQILCWQYVSY